MLNIFFLKLQSINPIAFSVGNINVYWYGLIITMAIILGIVWINLEAKKHNLDKDFFIDLMVYTIPAAIIGARLYYVLFNLDFYLNNTSEIMKIWHGGLAVHGAIIFGTITVLIFAKKKNISFWRVADILSPPLLLGQAIGRWGNFFNQEAYGTEVTREFLKGIRLPNFIIDNMYINGTYHHPTFLYESFWNIIGVLILISIRKKNPISGTIFLLYLIWYSLGRFFIEGLRTDSLLLFGSLPVAQLISIILFILSVILIFRNKKKLHERYYS